MCQQNLNHPPLPISNDFWRVHNINSSDKRVFIIFWMFTKINIILKNIAEHVMTCTGMMSFYIELIYV